MSTALITELKALQRERGVASPFPSNLEFERWADEVLPRLAFDKEIAADFKNCIIRVESDRALRVPVDRAMNDAVGVLNRAVVKLQSNSLAGIEEGKPSATTPSLEPPQKLTLKWIWEHAPVSVYASVFGAMAVAFAAGAGLHEFRSAVAQKGSPATASGASPPSVWGLPAAEKQPAPASAAK